MNGIVVLRALLMARPAVAALVGKQVIAGSLPEGTVLPALGLSEISRTETESVSMNGTSIMVVARIQVTVHAKDYEQQKQLLAASILGPGAHTGMIEGVRVLSITRAGVGPDMSDDAADIYEQSRDFKVTYQEPS